MAIDATGTPSTNRGYPKLNTQVDAPSGKGINAIVDAIDTDINTYALLKNLVDAKGDLLAATAADTVARLAVGTNGHVLTADSAESTGLKWAAASAGPTWTYASTPPGSPATGDIWVYRDADPDSTYTWMFRYNSGNTTYDWEFIGGSALSAIQTTSGSFTTNASYIDPSNLCSITVPRAGVYDIHFGVNHANNTANELHNYSVKVGSGTPVDNESFYLRPTTTGTVMSGARVIRNKTASASDVLKIQVKPSGNGAATHQWLSVVPVRVS